MSDRAAAVDRRRLTGTTPAATPRENRDADLLAWARSLPKIDLHRHLEGSLRLETLRELAQAHGIQSPPSADLGELSRFVQATNGPWTLRRYLACFTLLRQFYVSREAIQRIAREAVEDAARDNVRYLELRLSPVALARARGFALAHVLDWVYEAVDQAEEEWGTRTCLILQIGRAESFAIARRIVDLAIEHRGRVVRGIDLAGDEAAFPADRLAPLFARARDAGLGVTVHAGEASDMDGPNSIRTAVTGLAAQRIGHGIRAIEDPSVVRMLRERQITLEVCPTSNLHTGAVRHLAAHPLGVLLDLGVRATLASDNPSVSATTLSDEYQAAAAGMGLGRASILRMLRHAAEAAFIPDEEREWLRRVLREGPTSCRDANEDLQSANERDLPDRWPNP
jgi:adenosine deaminase